jgi:hypothetical protein
MRSLLGIYPNYDRSRLALRGKAFANQAGGTRQVSNQGVNDMQARIRIIKRGTAKGLNGFSAKPTTKSDRQLERETVDTVKGWVADWHERKVQLQTAADALVRSMDIRRDGTMQRLARVN